MDKVKEWLSELIGTSIAGVILRLVIVGLSLWTGSSTNVGDAVGVALDKDRSIAAAVELINETPKAEVREAVEAEGEDTP